MHLYLRYLSFQYSVPVSSYLGQQKYIVRGIIRRTSQCKTKTCSLKYTGNQSFTPMRGLDFRVEHFFAKGDGR